MAVRKWPLLKIISSSVKQTQRPKNSGLSWCYSKGVMFILSNAVSKFQLAANSFTEVVHAWREERLESPVQHQHYYNFR